MLKSARPNKVLKIRYYANKTDDRGIQKFLYDGGRAITYEPHPSFRKYINMYSLFTHNGYKYIRCKLDDNVSKIRYSITTFNKKNKVIDIVTVNERIAKTGQTSPVMLHHATSYACVKVLSVNGSDHKKEPVVYIKRRNSVIYTILSVVVTYAAMLALAILVRYFYKQILGKAPELGFDPFYFVIPSIIIGLVYARSVIRAIRRKV